MNSTRKLNYKKLGKGHPLIILHGLYGSGDNWLTIAKALSNLCEVYLVDQRNHGKSFHADEHNYKELANDLQIFMEQHEISKAMILGHSMGGKTAMTYAVNNPGNVSRLMIIDISPGSYIKDGVHDPHTSIHTSIIDTLSRINLSSVSSLREADESLEKDLPDKRLRQFLLKNLSKKDNGYQWNLNLDALRENLDVLANGLPVEDIDQMSFTQFPVLFIRGSDSQYISDNDVKLIKGLFPHAQLVTFKNAGHWLHAEQPELFIKTIKQFLLKF